MLDEHRGDRGARRERVAQRAQLVPAGGQRLLGRPAPLVLVEPEADQRLDQAARPAAAQVDGGELAGLGVARDEQGLDDPERVTGLHALERAHEAALEAGVGGEAVEEQLHGSSHRGFSDR